MCIPINLICVVRSVTDPEYQKDLDEALAAIEAERLRSRRSIQLTYVVLALLSVAAAVLFRFFHGSIGVSPAEGGAVGRSFLVLATANLLVLVVWEKLWQRAS